jgi:hypothetical protein
MTTAHGYDMTPDTPRYAITQFSYEEFLAFWPKMREELRKIRPMWRHWTEDFIVDGVAAQTLMLWGCGSPPNAEFVFFTQINVYPTMKVLSVPLALGSFTSDMMSLMDGTIENYARKQECDEIEIRGRVGWTKEFKRIGFKHEANVWSRPVANLRNN